MDRARLRQIIKEELSRAVNEMRGNVPMSRPFAAGVGAGFPSHRTDAAGYSVMNADPGMVDRGMHGGASGGVHHHGGRTWMEGNEGGFDEAASDALGRGSIVKGSIAQSRKITGSYTLTTADSDTEAGYLHAHVEMNDGGTGDADADTPWEAVSAAIGMAGALGDY